MHRSGLAAALMLVAVAGGAVFGWFVLVVEGRPIASDHWTHGFGTLILVRPLMLLSIPLAFLALTLGVRAIAGPVRQGLAGASTALYFACTMLGAAATGAYAARSFQPGVMTPDAAAAMIAESADSARPPDFIHDGTAGATMSDAWRGLVDRLLPTNVVREFTEGRLPGVLMFALLLGLALACGGSRCETVAQVMEGLLAALLRIVGWVLWIAPLGVFFLVAWAVANGGPHAMGDLASFASVVLGALAAFGLVVLPVILAVFGRANPYRYLWQVRSAIVTAVGTASSVAAMPTAIHEAERVGRCSSRSARFVIPIGSALNMNGTALFEAAAVVFLCQLHGIDMDFTEVIVVAFAAATAAVATAGVPGAALATMTIVINALNLRLASRGEPTLPESSILVIVAIDPVLDMARTALNVWGNLVGARIITRLVPDTEAEGKPQVVANGT